MEALENQQTMNTQQGQQNLSIYGKSYLYCWVATTTIGSFYFGYLMGIFNPIQFIIGIHVFHWDQPQTNFYSGILGAMPSFGAIPGAFFAGDIAAMIGRKKALLLADVIGVLGLSLTPISNLPLMITGRAISGIALGLYSALVPLFLNEISPIELKAFFGSIRTAITAFGILCSYLMAYGLPYPFSPELKIDNFWRYMILFPIPLILLRALLSLTIFSHETPKYLVQIDKHSQAKQVLKKIFNCSDDRVESHYKMLLEEKILEKSITRITMGDLFTKKYNQRMFIGGFLALLQQFTGINIIVNFSTTIFVGQIFTDDLIPTFSQYYEGRNLTSILGVLFVISPLFGAWLGQRYGRRTLFIVGLIGDIIGWGILSIFLDGISIKLALLFLIIVFGLTIGPMTWTYIAEILPGIGISIAMMIYWSSGVVIVQIYPLIVNSLSQQAAFALYFLSSIIGFIVIWFKMKETKDKTNSEIIMMYTSKEIQEEIKPICNANLNNYENDKDKDKDNDNSNDNDNEDDEKLPFNKEGHNDIIIFTSFYENDQDTATSLPKQLKYKNKKNHFRHKKSLQSL